MIKTTTELLKTAYDSYYCSAKSFHDQLIHTIERWDGTYLVRKGSFPDYQVQTVYNKHPFPMDDIRELVSQKFNELELSVTKVLNTIGDIKYNELADEGMDIINEFPAKLRSLQSYVILNKNMYFKSDAIKSKERTNGLSTVADETSRLDKEIKKMGNIYLGIGCEEN